MIFDCYSTLIDIRTDEGKTAIYDYLSLYLQYYGGNVNARGLKSAIDRERRRYLRGTVERYPEVDLEAVFQSVLKKEGIAEPFLAESCCKLFRLLSRERFRLFPDSLPVLQEMKRSGYLLAVVSDAQKVFCLPEGDILGLTPFFERIVLSTSYGFRKPDPRLFAIACDLLGVLPAETVYIGDHPEKDVKGAKEVGMQVVLLRRDSKWESPEMEPDSYASDLWQAWDWIRSIG